MIVGTRISVEQILGMIASGMSILQIIQEFPQLTESSVREAVAFAAVELDHTSVETLNVSVEV